jgi:outer membrane protein assembly factor BamD
MTKMFCFTEWTKRAAIAVAALGMLSSCIHKKYQTPITKDTQQPDKVLFDKSINDIEHGRFETARLELNTLMNTYESSEYLAKAKLALADSWYREGGLNGMAQAEAEYKDFELFYPTMEESAEAQYKICMIHYKQMDKADRDPSQALRAEDECRQLMVQYPNSKHAPQTAQLLRNIQEVLAGHEFGVGTFYFQRGANPAAANRLSYVADQYPLFSGTDEALWEAGHSYLNMGPKYRTQAVSDFERLVRDYPLSARAEQAKQQLQDLEVPVPEANRTAYDRQKYDEENYRRPSMFASTVGALLHGPDVSQAAKSGQPTMQDVAFPIPASVPKANNNEEASNNGSAGGTTDIQGGVVQDPTKLNQGTDARQAGVAHTPAGSQAAPEAIPSNHDAELKKAREMAEKRAKKSKKNKKAKAPKSSTPAAPPVPAAQTQPTTTPSDAQQPNLQAPAEQQTAPQPSGPQQNQ